MFGHAPGESQEHDGLWPLQGASVNFEAQIRWGLNSGDVYRLDPFPNKSKNNNGEKTNIKANSGWTQGYYIYILYVYIPKRPLYVTPWLKQTPTLESCRFLSGHHHQIDWGDVRQAKALQGGEEGLVV